MRKAFSLVLIMSLLATGLIAQEDACSQAIKDAERDVKSGLWRTTGCLTACLLSPLFGLGAVGVAYLWKSDPPGLDFLGQSSEYVNAYTDCYQEQAREIRTDEAFGGCIVGSLAAAGFYVVATLVTILFVATLTY